MCVGDSKRERERDCVYSSSRVMMFPISSGIFPDMRFPKSDLKKIVIHAVFSALFNFFYLSNILSYGEIQEKQSKEQTHKVVRGREAHATGMDPFK